MKVEDSERAVEIACGASFNVARMRDGSVMSWGLGESGQLGRGEPPVLRPDPHSRNYDTIGIKKIFFDFFLTFLTFF